MRTKKETQDAIRALLSKGVGIKKIADILEVSKNTVRKVDRNRTEPVEKDAKGAVEHLDRVRALYRDCKGNAVRIQEQLHREYGVEVGYSTLTKLIREGLLREPKKRAGKYQFTIGEEMQHDTSPHQVQIGGKVVKAQCASLVLHYSRMIFIQYFPGFTRFEATWFLADAIAFFDGACGRCMVDNTSVVVVKGSGSAAVIAPSLEAFGVAYGFEFKAHEVGDADRSAVVERNFHYAENNFLPGRTFKHWDDLNAQARAWCETVANAKPKRSLGMAPQAAFVMEKPELRPMPRHLPPVYKVEHRTVDNEGFVSLDTNRYSVPERLLGKKVEVFKHPKHVKIFFKNKLVGEHERVIGGRDVRTTAPGHHMPLTPARRREPSAQETILRGNDSSLNRYLDELRSRSPGRGVRAMQRLLCFKRRYPEPAFMAAVKQALKYGLYDLARLERLILRNVADDFFNIDPD